jgi:plasmid stabilization system protein ParE
VVWTEEAAESLDFFCEYIRERSPLAAKRVKKEIIQTAKRLSVYPEMFQIDEIFAEPNKNIRRFFRWSYKITYQVLKDQVVILGVFHTSSDDPKED